MFCPKCGCLILDEDECEFCGPIEFYKDDPEFCVDCGKRKEEKREEWKLKITKINNLCLV